LERALKAPDGEGRFVASKHTSPTEGARVSESGGMRAAIIIGWVVAGCLTLYAVAGIIVLFVLRSR